MVNEKAIVASKLPLYYTVVSPNPFITDERSWEYFTWNPLRVQQQLQALPSAFKSGIMSPFHFLLASVILYCTYIVSIVEADPTNSLTISTATDSTAIDSFGPSQNLQTDSDTNPEERVNIPGVSSIASKLSAAKKAKETAKWTQIDDWLDRFLSPEEVKIGLKLDSKFGDSLKKSGKYKFYEAYLAKFECSLDDLLRNKFDTYDVKAMLGLQTTPLNLLKQSDKLKCT